MLLPILGRRKLNKDLKFELTYQDVNGEICSEIVNVKKETGFIEISTLVASLLAHCIKNNHNFISLIVD